MRRQAKSSPTLPERYGTIFTIFIIAIFLILIFNLISVNKERFVSRNITKVYFADNMSAAHLEIIRRFNQRYAGEIEIVPVDLPFTKFSTNERKELLARSLRSRSSRIDIFAVDQIWVPRFVKWGEPLAKYFMQTDLSRIVPQALQTCYYGNVLVGIPLYLDVGVLYYRQDLLAKVKGGEQFAQQLKNSARWEDFIAFSRRAFPGRPVYLFQGDSYEGLVCNYFEILGNLGGSPFQSETLSFNNPACRQAARFLYDLIHTYRLAPVDVTFFNERDSYYYALRHDAPFFRGWSSYLKDIPLTEDEREIVRRLDVAMLPHFDDHAPTTIFGGWNLMISRYSTNKMEAYQFLKFILEEDIQRLLFEHSGFLPVINNLYEDTTLTMRYPYLPFFRKVIATGQHRPVLADYTKISDVLSFHLNKILKDEMAVDSALQQVDAIIYKQKFFLY